MWTSDLISIAKQNSYGSQIIKSFKIDSSWLNLSKKKKHKTSNFMWLKCFISLEDSLSFKITNRKTGNEKVRLLPSIRVFYIFCSKLRRILWDCLVIFKLSGKYAANFFNALQLKLLKDWN